VKEGKKRELEAKLREMIELSMQTQPKKSQPRMQMPASNFVIRRRKGEQDKRIFLSK